jgi:hypothetical protein
MPKPTPQYTELPALVKDEDPEALPTCDYCGSHFDDANEGHIHDEDCECAHCESGDERIMGYGFCSPECEMHFDWEGCYRTTGKRYEVRADQQQGES